MRHLVIAAVLVAGWFVPVANADLSTSTWVLDQSNVLADGVAYGQVRIDADSDAGTVKFTVDAFNVQPLYGTLNKFGLDQFGFNYQNVTSATNAWSVTLPGNWSQLAGGNISGFGNFMVAEDTNGANNRLPQLIFTITLPDAAEAVASNFAVLSTGNAAQGNTYFVAHVAGFSTPLATSQYIGGTTSKEVVILPVPSPSALVLGVIGLASLFFRKPAVAA